MSKIREKESLECVKMHIWASKTQKLPGPLSGPWTLAAECSLCTSATFGLRSWGPPLTKSWIRTCDSILFGYRLCGVILVRQIYTLEIILPIELRVTQNDTLAAYEPCNRTVTLVGELCWYKLVIFSVTQMWLLHLSLINDFSLDKKKYLRMVR